MLWADMDMRPANGPLEHGPEGFQRVDVGIINRPFPGPVVNGAMIVAKELENAVREAIHRN